MPDLPADAAPATVPFERLELDEVLHRLRNLEAELRNTQALVARTYERLQDPEGALARLRAEPDYDRAWDDPEPLVSVRIATYNQAELLCERALTSLRAQGYERWEALVVGDDCTDDTEARVRALGDPRIRFVNLPLRGPYPDDARARWYVAGIPPMNAGLSMAAGRWIAPLDHDDTWDDDHLEVLLAHARASRAEVAYARLRIVDAATGDEVAEMGAWPPQRGDFGFLSALHHAGLRAFRYDLNCRFADEPGDWNVARRMWDAGVRFSFLDRPVATVFHTLRHQVLTTEQAMIEDLRGWTTEVGEARDWWHARADRFEREYEWWRAESAAHAAEAERLREQTIQLAAEVGRLQARPASLGLRSELTRRVRAALGRVRDGVR